MYKAVRLALDGFPFGVSREAISRYRSQRAATFGDLRRYFLSEGILSASAISNWLFPNVHADVFLSHSHADENLAIEIAAGLQEVLGVTVFVDSCVWHYANDFLRVIDDEYCWNDDSLTYNYGRRNNSTAHVHMLLNAAIHRMIDKVELFLFLDSEESVPLKDYIRGDKTFSPWIFSELQFASQVRIRSPQRYLQKAAAVQGRALDEAMGIESLKIAYDLPTDFLINCSSETFSAWLVNSYVDGMKGVDALDGFYALLK